MPLTLPLQPSDTNYQLSSSFGGEQILFDVRWNSTDAAWYVDMYESDDSIIALNVKLVLGIPLGRRCQHDFFKNYTVMAKDTTGKGLEAGYDDIGTRVVILVTSIDEIFGPT